MKNLAIVLFVFSAFIFKGYSPAENFNLESKNLHKKVRKTIEHYYKYDKESGGFVKISVNINRFNDDGNLIETYSLYNSKYSESTPIKKLYNYNSDGLLISTKDISDKRGKFSSENRYTYDRKENLIKTESLYKDGSKYLSVFKNDKKGRVINKKEYSKKDVLTADINYTYKGDKKTANQTSFSSSDGSIIGNYVTTFNDDVKVLYKSEGKYGKSSTTFKYDKEGNLLVSNYTGKNNSKTTYDYIYDKKDNWVKKHYRAGKYQYFYFREIYFSNGNVTGSTDFDKRFINRLGNFDNVNVVPLKKIEKKETNNTSNKNSSYLKNKTWNFEYIYVKDKLKKLKGTVALKTLSDSSLKLNSDATFTVKFSTSTFNFNLKVNSFKTLDDKYEFKLSNSNNETGLLWIYKKTKPLKDEASGDVFNVNGLFLMKEKDGSAMSFYIK
jgi:hypothetical protein